MKLTDLHEAGGLSAAKAAHAEIEAKIGNIVQKVADTLEAREIIDDVEVTDFSFTASYEHDDGDDHIKVEFNLQGTVHGTLYTSHRGDDYEASTSFSWENRSAKQIADQLAEFLHDEITHRDSSQHEQNEENYGDDE